MLDIKDKVEYFNNLRPIFHYSCRRGWMNDPNGLIFYRGYYHLFYQHCPDRTVHGPMHWGHARSRDLIHWEELPIALFPDKNGTIFSGSIVYDEENSSGFGSDKSDPLVAIFTHNKETQGITRQYQSLAYSLDNGNTFEKFSGNPVLDMRMKDFRDPKVIRYRNKWIMLTAAGQSILIFSSDNLKDWKKESSFFTGDLEKNEIWECPDLIRFSDKYGNERWVLIVSQNTLDYKKTGVRYFVGRFNGTDFFDNTGKRTLWLDFGRDDYAAATFAELQGKYIQLGWMNCWAYAQILPEKGFRGSMTLPKQLILEEVENCPILIQKPADEVMKEIGIVELNSGKWSGEIMIGAFLINMENDRGRINFTNGMENILIGIDYTKGEISVDRSGCSKPEWGMNSEK